MGEKVELRDIDSLLKAGKLEEARRALTAMIATLADEPRILAEVYFRRGKIAWRQGLRAEAQSDYARAAALDPESPAAVALEQARDVEAFFNHDLYNP